MCTQDEVLSLLLPSGHASPDLSARLCDTFVKESVPQHFCGEGRGMMVGGRGN